MNIEVNKDMSNGSGKNVDKDKSKPMDKPLTLIIHDFTLSLISLINSVQLPLCIKEYVMKDVMQELHNAANIQAEQEKRAYEESVEKMKRGEGKE